MLMLLLTGYSWGCTIDSCSQAGYSQGAKLAMDRLLARRLPFQEGR